MLVLVMIALVTGTLAVTILSTFGTKLRSDRVTEQALARAKEALIAYATTDANRPGELPCPDLITNNGGNNVPNDGVADLLVGPACPSNVGRLPWKTLGLPDLRDGAGERLWYAVSDNFHVTTTAAAVPLNSDTQGLLTITGITPATNIVAVVFASGSAVGNLGQSRTAANENTASNYLEGTNATSTTNFATANASATFNDRLITIRPVEIFRLVEKRVVSELRTPGTYLAKYLADWGRYPYAAPFADTTVPANFMGTNGTYEGLFPAATSMNPVAWNAGASSMAAGIVPLGCSNGGNTMTCSAIALSVLAIGSAVTITAYANNVGGAFVDPITPASVAGLTNVTITSQTLQANGAAQIVITGQTPTPILFLGYLNVTMTRPQLSAWVNTAWVTKNEWPKVAYYAVARGYAPDGAGSCVTATNACGSPPTPPGPTSCLSICNTVTGAANNDVRAMITMTGPTLPGATPPQTRGPYTISNYLEDGNQSVSDYIFEAKPLAPTFNDQPFALAP